MTRLDWDGARRKDAALHPGPRRDPAGHLRKPTPKQLRYLRSLASKTGTTFAAPQTAQQASAEIKRLQALPQKHRK